MASPKAKLHQLFVNCKDSLRYETEKVALPVQASVSPAVPLLIPPTSAGSNGFRSTLYLPGYDPVVSGIFSKKKEAEQDAAAKALLQMGKSFSPSDSVSRQRSPEENLRALAERIEILFSEKSITTNLPLKEHFKAAIKQKGDRHGFVPATALAALDTKVNSICKCLQMNSEPNLVSTSACTPASALAALDAEVVSVSESRQLRSKLNPVHTLALVCDAVKECSSVTCDETGLWIKRLASYSTEFETKLIANGAVENGVLETSKVEEEGRGISVQAVYIPYSPQKAISPIHIHIEPDQYYMDVIALQLGVKGGGNILMSRGINRAPIGCKLFWPVPEELPSVVLPVSRMLECTETRKRIHNNWKAVGGPNSIWNVRASNLVGYSVFGDAILSCIGSTWKSEGKLFSHDISVTCCHRLMIGRTPEGNYKLSRKAILTAKLPNSYSGHSQWRGHLPRCLLREFCQQHLLTDPLFSFRGPDRDDGAELDPASANGFKCNVQVSYKGEFIECESEHLYRNRNDAAQSAALMVLLSLSSSISAVENPQLQSDKDCHKLPEETEDSRRHTFFHAPDKGELSKTLTPGSLVCMSYDVWLVGEEISMLLEIQEEFEFELGSGGVIGELDAHVSSMTPGETKEFFVPLPSQELLFAANGELANKIDKLALCKCSLKYNVKILRSMEPPEERMESALFYPPLSKQRNDFAICKIQEANAKSLVDLGCGSGSLLDAVFDHSTTLEHIAGVDISLKGLTRAAKSLHGKFCLCTEQSNWTTARSLKSAVLYEGSISEIDCRLCGFDVATCIEVVEHMDPEPLSKIGEVVLGNLLPRMLILSTPNIEYNPILHRMNVEAKANGNQLKDHTVGVLNSAYLDLEEDENGVVGETEIHSNNFLKSVIDPLVLSTDMQNVVPFGDEKSNQPCRLRNDDHRFEWTRAEFRSWADKLASQYGYAVEYSGVGGSEEDPGFASQVAIFTHLSPGQSSEANLRNEKAGLCVNGSVNFPGQSNTDISFNTYREVWKYERVNTS